MNISEYILDLKILTGASTIGLFGSSLKSNVKPPNDIDIFFKDCQRLPDVSTLKRGIESNFIKTYSVNCYGSGDGGGGGGHIFNGRLDITFFTSSKSFIEFLNYDNKEFIELTPERIFYNQIM